MKTYQAGRLTIEVCLVSWDGTYWSEVISPEGSTLWESDFLETEASTIQAAHVWIMENGFLCNQCGQLAHARYYGVDGRYCGHECLAVAEWTQEQPDDYALDQAGGEVEDDYVGIWD